MRSRRVAMVASLGLLVAAGESQAAARVFVSVTGNDANDCANVATPCRTFGASVTQVDPGGEVIVLASGSYGGVVIGKNVKINAPLGIVAFTAATIEVNAGVNDVVTLRGLTVKALTPGAGNGILFTAGKGLQVENCVIDGWNFGIKIDGPAKATILDTIVRNTGSAGVASGIHINNLNASAVIDNVSVIDGSKNGVGVSAGKATVRNSVVTGNFNANTFADGASELDIEKSLLANGGSGVGSSTGSTARISGSMITGNGVGFVNSATLESFGNNVVRGNTTNTSGTITTVALQ